MLEMLQYDMLYGEQTVYRYVTKPQPTVLQMGVSPITVTGLRQIAVTYPQYAEVDIAPHGAWQAGTDRGKGACSHAYKE